MQHRAASACVDLFVTRDAAGQNDPVIGRCLGPLDLVEQVLANARAQLMILPFVPETPRHAAAFGAGSGNIKAKPPQQVYGVGPTASMVFC